MKNTIVLIFAVGILTGCTTTPHVTRWEYKVAVAPRMTGSTNSLTGTNSLTLSNMQEHLQQIGRQSRYKQQRFLNDLGRDGWMLVNEDEGTFYLMRPLPAGAVRKASFAQTNADDVAHLAQRVARLEQQVQEISQLTGPLKAQQGIEGRRKALRERVAKRMAQDREKYTPDQLRDAEELYQVANQKWGSPEARASLEAMIKKYPDLNRTGCATLYLAQMSQGDERARYLQDCIEKYNDCFYGDGVQVGAYARFLLIQDYRSKGEEQKAEALCAEIKSKYADAVDHGGNLLVDSLKADSK